MPESSPIRRVALAVATLALCVPSAGAAPHASVGPVSCAAGGSIVTLSNDGGAPVRFVLLRDDAVVATHVVPAGVTALRRVVPVADGAAAQVTARYGASYASSYVRHACGTQPVGTAAPITTDAADAVANAPYGTAPVVPATSTRELPSKTPAAATSAPPAPAPVPQLDEPTSSVLVLLLAAIAALAVVGALAVALLPRRPVDVTHPRRRHEAAR